MKKVEYIIILVGGKNIKAFTVIAISPCKQITDVFEKICNKAIREKSLSTFSENVMTLLCFTISIPVANSGDP